MYTFIMYKALNCCDNMERTGVTDTWEEYCRTVLYSLKNI